MTSAEQALDRLRAGNQRFVASVNSSQSAFGHGQAIELGRAQTPFAIVLGCSDSRVPAEIVFDQGLGDLFVIRVAGNIVAPSQIGSVEFAVSQFDVRLVVVLGHSECGAVQATIDDLLQPTENQSHNIRSIVNRIKPSVEGLMQTDLRHDHDKLVQQSVRANIGVSVSQLRSGSEYLERMVKQEGLAVAGAEYSLQTGIVEFLDDN